MDLVIEAIDQQLAILWEARGILAGEPAGAPRKPARKPVRPARAAKPAPMQNRVASATKKPSPAQRALAFEHPPVAAETLPPPVTAIEPVAEALPEEVRPVVAKAAVRKAVRTPRAPKPASIATVAVPPVAKALASTIPAGPVVVMAASVAREREERNAKASPVHAITLPKTKSGLDALIEEAAARSGIKAEGLHRPEAS
jgi:hypothetical protein